tara:strand:- start:5657 stop:6157 length:501 start_codon:yes stop_codon:yes gene_type:complete
MVWTNLGKQRMFEEFFCSGAVDATFRVVLLDNTATSGLNADTSSTAQSGLSGAVVSSLPDGNLGGTSGLVVLRDGTADQANFDVSSASQLSASAARAVLQTANNSFQFSGAFSNARYVALVEAGAENSAFDFTSGKEIYAWWDIGTDTDIATGNTLTITNLSLQGQ